MDYPNTDYTSCEGNKMDMDKIVTLDVNLIFLGEMNEGMSMYSDALQS